ncbi:MAG TPA: RsmD family RNA methyltransferase, partial [Trueperaceae bacterium]|nr:RsmD family RNA methyltransferase [Trueperaceae bacterium]
MSKPRIIGGSAKGRELMTPDSGTRPSPSRLREALFDILAFEPRGRFLDLFSGSGAVGLEAASRGWSSVCVELAGPASDVIRRNATALGLDVAVVKGDAVAYATAHPGALDVVFAAPPYPLDLTELFRAVLTAGPVAPGGVYVLQHPTGFVPQVPPGVGAEEPRTR